MESSSDNTRSTLGAHMRVDPEWKMVHVPATIWDTEDEEFSSTMLSDWRPEP